MNNKRTDITYRISHKSQENRFFYFSQKTLQVEWFSQNHWNVLVGCAVRIGFERERERASEHHCYTKKILMKEYLELRYEEEMNLIQAED